MSDNDISVTTFAGAANGLVKGNDHLHDEFARLRAELAAELEASIYARAAHGAALLKIMKLREALVKARAWIVEGKVDFDDSLADAIDAVLKETGHE